MEPATTSDSYERNQIAAVTLAERLLKAHRTTFPVALVDRDPRGDRSGPEVLDHPAVRYSVAVPALILNATRYFKVIQELQRDCRETGGQVAMAACGCGSLAA